MYIKSLKLCNDFLDIYYDEYNKYNYQMLKRIWCDNQDPESSLLKGHDDSMLSKNKEVSADKGESVDLYDKLPIECCEEEVREENGIKVLTPNKLFTGLRLLLAQIKAGKMYTN